MNLTINSDDIRLVGVDPDNTTITIEDNIGFSTADLDSGFNYSDASPDFTDGDANAYPDTSEVVFFLQAWHIPYDDSLSEDPDAVGTVLNVTRVRDEILPALDTATATAGNFVYGDNLNEWRIEAPKDGWIKIRMFALDVNGATDTYYYVRAVRSCG